MHEIALEREKEGDLGKTKKGERGEDAEEGDDELDEDHEKRGARKTLTLKAPAKKGVQVEIEEEEEEV